MTLVMKMMVLTAVLTMVTAVPLGTTRRSLMSEIITRLLSSRPSDMHIQDTGELGMEAGYLVETHTVTTEDGYILTLHHVPRFANPSRRLSSIRSTNTHSRGRKRRRYETYASANVTLSTSESVQEDKPSLEDMVEVQPNTTVDNLDAQAWEYPSHPYKSEDYQDSEKVVFLQHGLMGSSDNWNTNTKEDSLAYLLSDAGYDVWMGNFRGNIYSRNHNRFTDNDPSFWRFSFDEMARFDLPAMLDYVKNQTEVKKLHYLGHSMGTTVFFALMSSKPEYQQRIASMVALAPVATVTSITSPIKYLAPLVNELQFVLRLFGNDQELMTNRLLISLWDPYHVCMNQAFCENLQFIITGFDPSRADQEMVPVILSHNPAGASTQTLFHFAQMFRAGRFQHFDWGQKENLKQYGQVEPPEYDVKNIKVPITMFWSLNDWLIGEEDIHRLEKDLPQVEACYKVPNPMFSHLDFLWATDARYLVYEKVFDILDEAVKISVMGDNSELRASIVNDS